MEFGFIGVGAMGGPLARNLIRAGKTVHVYNRSAAGRDKTLAVGTSGLAATSMAHMAPCKVVFTCLALPQHLTEKALGQDGLYAHMQPGAVHVELSTIDSQTAFALAEAAGKQALPMCSAPLAKLRRMPNAARPPCLWVATSRPLPPLPTCGPYLACSTMWAR